MKAIIFVISALFISQTIGFAATIFVPDDHATIQDAISAASAGDTIIVRPNTYVENVDFLGKAVTVQSEGGAAATVVDGNASGSVVTFKSGEGSDSVLDGFSLMNGSGVVDPDHPEYSLVGGGIYCKTSSPTIVNNVVTGNTTDGGAGICCTDGAHPKILDNVVTDNTTLGYGVPGGTGGAGICAVFSCNPEIVNNFISGNVSGELGGGILFGYSSAPTIRNNTIAGNNAEYSGGIGIGHSSAGTIEGNVVSENRSNNTAGGIGSGISNTTSISNNLIFGNTAASHGGGLYIYYDSVSAVTNNTIISNSAGNGGGVALTDGGSSTIVNTILWNNSALEGNEIYVGESTWPSTATVSFSDVEGGLSSCIVKSGCTLNWGTGMIDADPLLADTVCDDFHLTWPSPCRNAGDNSAATQLSDFEGDPRIADGTVDMGADEFHLHLYMVGSTSPGLPVTVKIAGTPGTTPVTLGLGSGIQDPPQSTPYGDLYLQFPILRRLPMPDIGSDGLSALTASVPGYWLPGEQYPFQVLAGSELTNLMVIEVH